MAEAPSCSSEGPGESVYIMASAVQMDHVFPIPFLPQFLDFLVFLRALFSGSVGLQPGALLFRVRLFIAFPQHFPPPAF